MFWGGYHLTFLPVSYRHVSGMTKPRLQEMEQREAGAMPGFYEPTAFF